MADEKPGLSSQVRRKLKSKERWAREGRLLTGRAARPEADRLPPGQRQVTNWPILDIHCVTAWSSFGNRWDGVSAKHLLSVVKPKPEARFLWFTGYDDYTTNLPLSAFDEDAVLLAHSWQGKPIPRDHGGPVRAVVPKLYFWQSAKWIRRITFIAEDRPGFWEERGYHMNGDPWMEERYG